MYLKLGSSLWRHPKGCVVSLLICLGSVACSSAELASQSASVEFLPDDSDALGFFTATGADPTNPVIQIALTKAVVDCMKARGFDYRIELVVGEASLSRAAVERGIVFGIPATSSAVGLGLSSSRKSYEAEVQRSKDSTLRAYSAAAAQGTEFEQRFSDALVGTGAFVKVGQFSIHADGCQAQGYLAAFTSIDDGIRLEFLPAKLRGQVEALAYADSTLAPALRTWESCMRNREQPYPTPTDAFRALEAKLDPDSDTAVSAGRGADDERILVSAFKDCDAASGLYSKGWAVARQLAQQVAVDNATDIQLFGAAIQSAKAHLTNG